MLFNPDPCKPVQEVVFSRKKKTQSHRAISLNNIQVERTSYQKHLGLLLDEKLNFKQHVDSGILKMNKGISVIKKIKTFMMMIDRAYVCIYLLTVCRKDTKKHQFYCSRLADVSTKIC